MKFCKECKKYKRVTKLTRKCPACGKKFTTEKQRALKKKAYSIKHTYRVSSEGFNVSVGTYTMPGSKNISSPRIIHKNVEAPNLRIARLQAKAAHPDAYKLEVKLYKP